MLGLGVHGEFPKVCASSLVGVCARACYHATMFVTSDQLSTALQASSRK